MYQRKQYIYSENQGLCRIQNIVSLSSKRNRGKPIQYYVLKPVFEPGQIAYIPVEDHKVRLREIFTVKEAEELMKNPRLRKNVKLRMALEFVLEHKGESDGTASDNQ